MSTPEQSGMAGRDLPAQADGQDLWVRDGLIQSSSGAQLGDVLIRAGKIEDVLWHDDSTRAAARKALASSGAYVLDAQGLWVLPGVIDSQVHFREPGLEHKEDLGTGSLAALLGGVTTFLEMPNTNPATVTRADLENKLSLAQEKSHTNYGFFIGASKSNTSELIDARGIPGCVGIKIFLGSSTGDLLLYDPEVLERIFRQTTMTISLHSENEELLRERRSIYDNARRVAEHVEWRNEEVALSSTRMVVELARRCQRRVHVLHVSTGSEMRYLAQNKDLVTVEVTPQHLTLESPGCYESLGTLAQMNPPIRSREHREALWQGVRGGTVDIIASDHAPHTLEEKAQGYPGAPSGMPGVQTLLPVMLDHVAAGSLSLSRLISLVCERPAQLFSLNKGRVLEGYDGDLTLVDPRAEVTLRHQMMVSRSPWTPFHNKKLSGGFPVASVIGGQVAMVRGKLVPRFKSHRWGVGPALRSV